MCLEKKMNWSRISLCVGSRIGSIDGGIKKWSHSLDLKNEVCQSWFRFVVGI